MISVSAFHLSRCYFLNKKKLNAIVRPVLRSVGVKDAALSVVFATDAEMRRLNHLYRGRNRFTDVLSFSMREGKRLKKDSSILGDIVISLDRAKKQARRFKSSFKKETYLYIIHGILHLVGYEDETPAGKKEMQKKEMQALSLALYGKG